MTRALITGSNSGLGEALRLLFEEKGIQVIPWTRNDGDLATQEGREKLFSLIRAESPDWIINNAGLGFYGPAHEMALKDAEQIVEVNITALMEITMVATKNMIEKGKKGVILNVSSIAGEIPTPGMAVYGASKSFVTSFSRAVDHECSPYGVRVLASLPGQISTPFASKAAKKDLQKARGAMSACEAAKEILWQIQRKKQKHVYSSYHRFLHFVSKYLIFDRVTLDMIYHAIKKNL